MSKGLEAFENIKTREVVMPVENNLFGEFIIKYQELIAIEKELKALEIIKDFVWIENDEIHLGLYGDSEIVLRENDFENKEKYYLLKEALL